MSASIVATLAIEEISSFGRPRPSEGVGEIGGRETVPVPLAFLSDGILSSYFLLQGLSGL